MFLLELLMALVVAIVLTLVFAFGFRNRGPWGLWWLFLLIVFLAAWAGGLWITPFGPTLFQVAWLPMLLSGLFFALLLAAAVPPRPGPATAPTADEVAAASFGVFLWALLLGLIIAVLVAYLP